MSEFETRSDGFESNQHVQPPNWQADRASGLAQLQSFVPRAGRAYAQTRNSDLGAGNHTNVSVLSPWLRHRLVLEEEVVRATLDQHSLSGSEKFIQEVFWRAYFKGWLEHRPAVWQAYRRDVGEWVDRLEKYNDLNIRYTEATEGRTGIDCFDFWVSELRNTGYLHNHARMWFASIWIFTLQLPWQLGADFFYRHLIDGDPASNTLSWRWVGGLHTKGKHYLARPDNIERFTNGRFQPEGLVTNAQPLSESEEFPIVPIDWNSQSQREGNIGLLLTEEDLHSESLTLDGQPKAILALAATHLRSPLDTGILAATFAKSALQDALTRAEAHYECEGKFSQAHDWCDTVLRWAKDNEIVTVMTARAPVGPVKKQLVDVEKGLAEVGVTLKQIPRAYDQMCWPHATKGFFKLKKQIPNLVETW